MGPCLSSGDTSLLPSSVPPSAVGVAPRILPPFAPLTALCRPPGPPPSLQEWQGATRHRLYLNVSW